MGFRREVLSTWILQRASASTSVVGWGSCAMWSCSSCDFSRRCGPGQPINKSAEDGNPADLNEPPPPPRHDMGGKLGLLGMRFEAGRTEVEDSARPGMCPKSSAPTFVAACRSPHRRSMGMGSQPVDVQGRLCEPRAVLLTGGSRPGGCWTLCRRMATGL